MASSDNLDCNYNLRLSMSHYCDRCDRGFYSSYALNCHERDSAAHNICHDCGIDYSTLHGLKEHWVQSRRHAYCQYCDEHFDDVDELQCHYKQEHPYCDTCQRVFKSQYGLEEHYRQSSVHYYCQPCQRHFRSDSNLQAHLNSSIHRPKDQYCPLGCGKGFVSNSAMVLHLESGSCPSGVTRQSLNRYVRNVDKQNFITTRLLTNGDEHLNDTTWIASESSWNGRSFECYLCHSDFGTLRALNGHLNSPRHQEKVYRCPWHTCGKQFAVLSGLFQHIESQSCGVSKFKPVQAAMDRLKGGMRTINYF